MTAIRDTLSSLLLRLAIHGLSLAAMATARPTMAAALRSDRKILRRLL